VFFHNNNHFKKDRKKWILDLIPGKPIMINLKTGTVKTEPMAELDKKEDCNADVLAEVEDASVA
jgi:hypothetical protein